MWQVAAIGNYCVCLLWTSDSDSQRKEDMVTFDWMSPKTFCLHNNNELCSVTVLISVSLPLREAILYIKKKTIKTLSSRPPHPCVTPINPINPKASRQKWTRVRRNESEQNFGIYIFIIAVLHKTSLTLGSS